MFDFSYMLRESLYRKPSIKTSILLLALPLVFLLVPACRKGGFRSKFAGDFEFRVVKEFKLYGQPTEFDTINSYGEITKYKFEHESMSFFDFGDSLDPKLAVTVKIDNQFLFCSEIDKNGVMPLRYIYSKGHSGYFVGKDSLYFEVYDIHLGGGTKWYITGKRL